LGMRPARARMSAGMVTWPLEVMRMGGSGFLLGKVRLWREGGKGWWVGGGVL